MAISRHGRLLLIEDEHRLRGLISTFLRMEGFEIVEAENGRRGIDLFLGVSPFDMVIVDLELPECSGIEVCRAIRRGVPNQPILVCSAAILGPHFSALDELAVHRYLTKPYLPSDLLNEIARGMGRIPSHPPLATAGTPVGNRSRRPTVSSQSQGLPPQSLFKPARSQ